MVKAGSGPTTRAIETESARRVYRSALRARQAQQTREHIVAAAEQLFSVQGYAATSLAEIAQLAEVSIESVAAHGPKRSLLLAALDLALGGRPTDAEVAEPANLVALCRRHLPADVLAGLADLLLARRARSAGMWRALVAAATGDPELAAVHENLARCRRDVSLTVVRLLAERGLLRVDRSLEELADTATLLAGPEAYQLLVRDLGWSEAQYRAWYVDSMQRLLR